MKQPIESAVMNAISTSAGIPENAISSNQSLDDLGLNSILAVQLLTNLQDRLGISVDQNSMSTSNTVGEIVDYFQSKAK
ncbi:acyl carrier protein [Chitinophaga dinghuensis]|uniref:Acyl carrier protein n=1 Tax=Chitinophaga dinghuensis TaxID=1539050 RepID=A0A327W0V6_9BACT|nr:acyl carrier protein [Chitinophaga dinghuensis]RAJ82283.1 acyl carrier protein [Chitinophaga dinghuensis]